MSAAFTTVNELDWVTVPRWVKSLRSFRRWSETDEFPEKGRICYLAGEVWVDMSREQLFSHVSIKSEFTAILRPLVKEGRLGHYFGDGAYISNPKADLSAKPDGCFVSQRGLDSGRARFVKGKRRGFVEIEGSPDMVLEVVSDSSVEKDTVRLFDLYWQAGVTEYWLVDARGDQLSFDINRRTPEGFVATSRRQGWVKSDVFGKSFRLTTEADDTDQPDYTLSVR